MIKKGHVVEISGERFVVRRSTKNWMTFVREVDGAVLRMTGGRFLMLCHQRKLVQIHGLKRNAT